MQNMRAAPAARPLRPEPRRPPRGARACPPAPRRPPAAPRLAALPAGAALPCRPARDHWKSPLQDTFVITAWGGPDLTYFANGTSKEVFHKEGGVKEYAEAGFNLLTVRQSFG